MANKHPCHGLSKADVEAFERVAIGQAPDASKRTLDRLLDFGLIEITGERWLGRGVFGDITVPIYAVPIPVHMRWCAWCSEHVS